MNKIDKYIKSIDPNFIIEDTTHLKRVKKKKKEEKNKDGIKIEYEMENKYFNFRDDKKNKKLRVKENIIDWTTKDIVLYIKDCYYQKYHQDCGLQIPFACKEINQLKEDLESIFSIVENILIKKYIDFFFEYWVDIILEKEKGFYFSQLRNEKILNNFYNIYFTGLINNGKNKKEEDVLNNKIMKFLYSLSIEKFVYTYGIILSINWLILQQNFSPKEAIKKVNIICKKAYYNKNFSIIEESTNKFSPYPNWFQIKKVGVKVNVNIEFNDLKSTIERFEFFYEKK